MTKDDDDKGQGMSISEQELGTIEKSGNQYRARLVRDIDHDLATVWSMLTDADKFVDWLAPGEIEPRRGGAAKLNFVDSGIVIDSTVSEYDPPKCLEYSWSGPGEPDRPVRWELQATDDSRTRLVLTLGLPADEDVARSCAGWEAHLMMMLAALEGVPIKFPFERFQETRAAYNALL